MIILGRRIKNPSKFWDSAYKNNVVFNFYLEQLKEIAINAFEWINLPSTIDERFLELTLCEKGMAVFFEEPVLEKYITLPSKIGGKLNLYNIPMRRTAYANNGYNMPLTDNNSVLIFNNYLHTPDVEAILNFTYRLYEIQSSIDVNVKQQKFPAIIKSSEQQRLTMKNLYMQYDGNEPFIFGDKDLDVSQIQVLNTGAPYVSDKLSMLKKQVFNEALDYFGVENNSFTKNERLVAAEVSADTGSTSIQRYIRLNARKQACKQINEMFGLNLDVRYRVNNVSVERAELEGINNE